MQSPNDPSSSEPLSVHDVLNAAALIWPRLRQIDDCVLLDCRYSEGSYRRWRTHLGDDSAGVEGMINHTHLWDEFTRADEECEEGWERAVESLADILVETWRAAARQQFPHLEFDITLGNGPDDYGPTLYMTTRRPAPPMRVP